MRRLLLLITAIALAACSGGVTPPPPPTPTPLPLCGSAAPHHLAALSTHMMRPRSAANQPVPGALAYGGGSVLLQSKVYLVLWGLAPSDPDAQRLEALYNAVGGSDWLNTVTQYCQRPSDYIVNPTGILAGVWSDTAPTGSPKQAQIAQEALTAAQHFNADPATASIVIAFPKTVNPQGFPGGSYCAWHSAVGFNGGDLSYTNMPYIANAGASCGATGADPLYGLSVVAGHELAESITDPKPSTGWTGNGGEIGDKCAWVDLQSIALTPTVALPMQPLWSNAAAGCVQ